MVRARKQTERRGKKSAAYGQRLPYHIIPIAGAPSWQSRRSRIIKWRAKSSLTKPLLLLILLGCVIVVFVVLSPHNHGPNTPNSIHKNYYANSKYKNIRSHIEQTKNARMDSFIEYPITQSDAVNKTVSDAINTMHRQFMKQINGRAPKLGTTFSEKVGFAVPFVHGDYVSLAVSGKYDTEAAQSYTRTEAWTFNTAKGSVVSVDDLVGHSSAGKAVVLQAVQRKLADKLGVKNVLTDGVNDMAAQSFVVHDASTLAFYFSEGMVAPSSAGSLIINVPIDATLAPFLQNSIAKALFDVPALAVSPPSAPVVTTNCVHQKCIALSFDDGPGKYTNKLLDTLQKYNVHATFFLVGREVPGYAKTVKREVADGNVVGNHTWDHADLTKLSSDKMQSQIQRTSDAIFSAAGVVPTLLRPPYGATNNAVQLYTKNHLMESIFWSIDTRDWADQNSKVVCNRALANAQAGAIILMHDIYKTTVDAVPCIIQGLTRQGYTLVTVPQLLGKLVPGTNYYRLRT